MLLTFEYDDGALEVNLDEEGRRTLLLVLERLTPGDHQHLATPEWGGSELTGGFANPDLSPIHLSPHWAASATT